MADAGDLKSLALDGRAGSSPALAIFHRSPERFFVRGFFCRRFAISPFSRFSPFFVAFRRAFGRFRLRCDRRLRRRRRTRPTPIFRDIEKNYVECRDDARLLDASACPTDYQTAFQNVVSLDAVCAYLAKTTSSETAIGPEAEPELQRPLGDFANKTFRLDKLRRNIAANKPVRSRFSVRF